MTVPSSPRWIEDDAYDRARLAEVREAAPVRTLEERGAKLLPRFEALFADLFAALFKENVIWQPPEAVAPSARINRFLLEGLLAEAPFAHLRERTRLSVSRAALGALLLAERALDLLTAEQVASRRTLLEQFDLADDEREIERLSGEAEKAEQLGRVRKERGEDAKDLEAVQGKLERERDVRERRLAEKADRAAPSGATAEAAKKRLELAALEVADGYDTTADDAEEFEKTFGGSERDASSRTLDLGRRLARNRKLAELARVLGRMRDHARALRRRVFERANEETHSIETGAAIERVLPAELVALRHPTLRREWLRRFAEGELLQYAIAGRSERGRGPVVALVDVSSSMAGDKEIWAKAVALTLLEIARREHRRFRAILFSSGSAGIRVFEWSNQLTDEPDVTSMLDLAEHFPGGGTSFEEPLDLALACLRTAPYRRGDVVLVTDGECRVAADWQHAFEAEKRRLDFSLYAILVDIGASDDATIRTLADRITRVSKLTAESASEIFERI